MQKDECKSNTTLTDTDRAEMKKATKDAWAKAEAATAGRTPRFGYRPVQKGSTDV